MTVTEVTLKGKYNTPKRVSRTNTLLKNKKRKKRVWEKWHFERNPPVFANLSVRFNGGSFTNPTKNLQL